MLLLNTFERSHISASMFSNLTSHSTYYSHRYQTATLIFLIHWCLISGQHSYLYTVIVNSIIILRKFFFDLVGMYRLQSTLEVHYKN